MQLDARPVITKRTNNAHDEATRLCTCCYDSDTRKLTANHALMQPTGQF